MSRKVHNRFISVLLVLAMIVSVFSCMGTSKAYATETEVTSEELTNTYNLERFTNNYTNVSVNYTASVYQGETIVNAIDQCADLETATIADDNYGYINPVLSIKNAETVTVLIDAPETALYWIAFDYLSYDASILPIEFSLTIDGSYPFYEARNLTFESTWVADAEASFDRYGNEIVSLPNKEIKWESKFVMDNSYRYSDPLLVELTKGSHEFTMCVNEGSMLMGNISLVAPSEVSEYTASQIATGDDLIVIQGEDFYERNDSSIHAVGEYDASLDPISATSTVLNTVDADSFSTAGQEITYQFHVEEAGNYYLGLNYYQAMKNEFPVFIDWRIDGEIPNTAFQGYSLGYSSKYKTDTLVDENGENLSVYLEEGNHTISMTISADKIRYVLEEVDLIMNGINDLSLEVTKVAGTNKDKYRDLKLTKYIPDVQERLYAWVDELYYLAELATEYVDADQPEDVAAFSYLVIAAKQLKSLGDEPNELIYRVDELSTSVNSINTQIANFIDVINDNNISIDRIYLYQEDAKLPKGRNIFQSLGLSFERFVNSFFGQAYSASNVNEEHIQVWVNRPRQYVEIMQKMIDEQFTPETGIEVDLCLMTDQQKLVLANASGDTPDVATGINYSIPFELGIRGALVDLTKFDDYQEIFGRYSEGLLVPAVIGEGLYSLPETMNFYVLFTRSDILGKLNLEVPNTMDDLIAMLPDLQMRGLNVYYQTAPMLVMRNFHGTTPLIFQNGGELYGDTILDLEINNEESIQGFTKLTELFTIYDLPVDIPNFYQHFRNGDLPIGIADFNSYNLILNAAPEIANSWEISLVPGTVDEATGEIKRYMSGGAESTVMFESNPEREAQAWEFMKWWSSASVQAEFGQTLQIMYGKEYIWPTANLEAFANLPFPTRHKAIIMEQAEQIVEAPRLLGSYMLERELSNAYNDIVVNGDTLRARMDDVVKTVNRETKRKLEEFGYIDADGNVIKEYVVPSVSKVKEILGTDH